MAPKAEEIEKARARRWWLTRRRVGSIDRAGRFLSDVGFALLFPKRGIALPSLWEVATDRPIHELGEDWGPDAERVWGWKDELPRRGVAWYGKFLRGRASFLSPALLADLYPRGGRPDDFADAALSPDGSKIARILLRSGPQSTAALREATGVEGKLGADRFSKAISELGRALVVTHFGAEDEGAGWPSAVLELTARAFPITRRQRGRGRAAGTFLDTMIAVRPHELGNAFGWAAAAARSALEDLVSRGEAERYGPVYYSLGSRATSLS